MDRESKYPKCPKCRKSDNVFPTIANPIGDYVCMKCICIFNDKKTKSSKLK